MGNSRFKAMFGALLTFFFLGGVGVLFLLHATWDLFIDWGTFKEHDSYLLEGLLEAINGNAFSQTGYGLYLTEYKLWLHFWAHLLGPILVCVPPALFVAFKLWQSLSDGYRDIHISGNRLLEGRGAEKQVAKILKPELKDKENSGGKGIKLHPRITISAKRELGNILVFGQQGSGKSVVIKELIRCIRARNDKAIIYDQKREYSEIFFDSCSSILLSPTDKRSEVWNPSLDVKDTETAKLFVECLVEHDSGEKFWTEGAQLIFTGWLVYLLETKTAWGWEEVRELLYVPYDDLDSILRRYYPLASNFIEAKSKTTQGFMTILATKVGWLNELADLWPNSSSSDFSVRRWFQSRKVKPILLLPQDPMAESMSNSICRAVLAISTRAVLVLNDCSDRKLWLALDELGNMPANLNFEKQLSLGRSKGLRTIAGVQSLSQLRTLYGVDKTETILSLFSSVICLRIGPVGDSAAKASELFGTKRVKRPTETINPDGSKSVTYHHVDEAVVTSEDINALPQASKGEVTGFLYLIGCEVVSKLKWPIKQHTQIAKPFVRNKKVGSKAATHKARSPNAQDSDYRINRLRRRP